MPLTPLHLSSHGSVELAETLAQARLGRHGLEHAAADAAGLATGKGLGGEVVDAGGEAVVYEVAEDLFVFVKWLVRTGWDFGLGVGLGNRWGMGMGGRVREREEGCSRWWFGIVRDGARGGGMVGSRCEYRCASIGASE